MFLKTTQSVKGFSKVGKNAERRHVTKGVSLPLEDHPDKSYLRNFNDDFCMTTEKTDETCILLLS